MTSPDEAVTRTITRIGPDPLAVDIEMYLVLTRHGQSFISDDPQSVPDLLLAVGPATLGVDGYGLPEDLAAALAQRVGIALDQPDTWPHSADAVQLREAHPELHILP
ncbi:MAG TPA: hypothetical protein VIU62_04325 [Chloroflexota bacterium]|jgi:hypothetical protein